ncbi:Fur family transcriptional regulator [Bacillus salipaludis]|uniref:Fur family transcriptional regulator n=1 Tax=Bacillus salipaludis TaxID=2547811 RepID=UPI002E1DDE44|nr:Fur family transcriptional regulator [Bacillus salipaludis]
MINHQRFQQGFEALKKNGLRMTPQRLALLEYMAFTELHPTVDDICKDLKNSLPSLTPATIYSNLKCFKKYNLINELSFGEFASRYEWATPFHYHVRCKLCGNLVDLNYPKLTQVEEFAQIQSGFDVTHHFFELQGTCPNCQ